MEAFESELVLWLRETLTGDGKSVDSPGLGGRLLVVGAETEGEFPSTVLVVLLQRADGARWEWRTPMWDSNDDDQPGISPAEFGGALVRELNEDLLSGSRNGTLHRTPV